MPVGRAKRGLNGYVSSHPSRKSLKRAHGQKNRPSVDFSQVKPKRRAIGEKLFKNRLYCRKDHISCCVPVSLELHAAHSDKSSNNLMKGFYVRNLHKGKGSDLDFLGFS